MIWFLLVLFIVLIFSMDMIARRWGWYIAAFILFFNKWVATAKSKLLKR